MHNSSYNDNSSILVLQRVSSPGNRNSVLRSIHVSVNDMVFAANEHTRRALESRRVGKLATRNLDEEVGTGIRWFTPFSDDVIQTQV